MAQFDVDLQLSTTTLKAFDPKNKITDLASTLQNYTAMNALMSKNRMDVEAGTQFQWQVRVGVGSNATWTKPNKSESTGSTQPQVQATMPIRHCRYDYKLDERTIAANRDPARLYDLWKDERESALINIADLMEDGFWGVPDAADDETMHGIKYWVTAIGATATLGLNGTLPTGYSAVGGLVPATYAQWANRNGLYGTVSKTGLIRMAREAATKSQYKPPVNSPSYSTGYKHGYYTNYAVYGKMEEELEKQNQSLGNDVASKDGMVIFRRTPVEWVPKLDADTANPFYGLDWGTLKFRFLKGEVWKELPALRNPTCLREILVRTYASLNLICFNRRNQFILTAA